MANEATVRVGAKQVSTQSAAKQKVAPRLARDGRALDDGEPKADNDKSITEVADAVVAEEAEKKVRPEFDVKTAINLEGVAIELDDDGRMTGIPTNWSTKFKLLARGDFTTKLLFSEHRLYLLDLSIAKTATRRRELVADIQDIRMGGDPKYAKIKQVKKLADQFANMIASLADDGIDISDLGIALPGIEKDD